jgi:MFS family permease
MSEALRPVAGAVMPEPINESSLPAPEKLRTRSVLAIASAQFGTAIPAVALVLVAWPITIGALDPVNKALILSLVSGLGAFVGIFVTPIAGVLSDRCASRFGMRRPFLIFGAIGAVGGMLLMGVSSTVGVLVAGSLLFALGSGIYAGGNYALVPDQIPERYRGRVMGLSMVMTTTAGLVASITLPMLIGSQFLMFAVPGAVMAATTVLTVFLIKDRKLDSAQHTEKPTVRGLFAQFKINPREIPDYSWAWAGKVVVTLGTVLTTVYGVYFLTDHLDVPAEQLPGTIAITGIIGLLTAVGGAILGSWISDRFRIRKNMVLYTSSLIFLGAVLAAFAPNVAVYLVALALMGIGTGAYFPVDGAVMIDVLPGGGQETGKYMGLMALADQLPRSIGPFIAAGVLALGGLIPAGGYPTVFIAGGVIAIIGGLLIRKVKGSV